MARHPTPPRTRGQLRARAEQSEAAQALLPVRRYAHHLVVAAGALIIGAFLALAWVNSPWRPAYDSFWGTTFGLRIGTLVLEEDLHGLVVDGLMTVFFFVVTLEVKRELVVGELSDLRRAAFPLAGALGGILAPALIFLGVNLTLPDGRPEAWGIPVATDVAFAMGALALLGSMSGPLRTLLLSMTVADDITVILLIAIVYSSGLNVVALVAALLLMGLAVLMLRIGLHSPVPFVGVGIALWLVLHVAGIHPTLAGVAMAALVPARPARSPGQAADAIVAAIDEAAGEEELDDPDEREDATEIALGRIDTLASATEPPVDRISRIVQPWSRFIVLPTFALAAAGVPIPLERIGEVVVSPVALGILLGLAIGKPLGILGAMWLAERSGLGHRPQGIGWRQLAGIGLLGGIGFTVSLFVTPLALQDVMEQETAKLAILAASLLAGGAGLLWLRLNR